MKPLARIVRNTVCTLERYFRAEIADEDVGGRWVVDRVRLFTGSAGHEIGLAGAQARRVGLL